MNLSKKTTILLPPDLHEQLTRQAEREGKSFGDLVLRACRVEYGFTSQEERRRALDDLMAMELPVGEPDEMKCESVSTPVETRASDRRAHRTS